MKKHIVNPIVEAYLQTTRQVRHPVLVQMERVAAKSGFPIVGPDVGSLLHILAKLGGARRVFELGSGFGYSAFWFAMALPATGQVHCTDTSEENRRKAETYFAKGGLSQKLRYHTGDALESLKKTKMKFDIIFNDIDKEDYPRAIDLVYAKLNKGGLFISDNTLWKAEIAYKGRQSAAGSAIIKFNRLLKNSRKFSTLILPIRDGVTIALKK